MEDVDLKMTTNENKSRRQIEEYWSEHILIKFGLEYIKHDILINEYNYKNKNDIATLKDSAVNKLAQILHIEANKTKIAEMCDEFRQEVMFLLRQVVRQCFLLNWDMKGRWHLDFAMLLMPSWLRTVEKKLIMLPHAVMTERRAGQEAEAAMTARFKTQLREGGEISYARGDDFKANDFKKVSAYYNITMTEALDVWKGVWSQTRQRILQEVGGKEGARELDWELIDLLLLHDLSFNIVTPESLSQPKQIKKLTHLYQAVLKKDIENVLRNQRPRLMEAWLQVLANYPFSLGFSSVVYIQRQWYELKRLARSEVLAYHLGHTQTVPHPLLLSIVANFRHIVQEPLPKWSDYVTSKMVVKFKDISKTLSRKVLEKIMDEVNKARELEEIENNWLSLRNVCVVQPLNNIVNGNEKLHTNRDNNELAENNTEANKNDKEIEKNKLNLVDDVTDNTVATNIDSKYLKSNMIIREHQIDLNEVLNNMDPSKVQKCLILDSDSDTEIGEVFQKDITKVSKVDKKSNKVCDLKILNTKESEHNLIDENDIKLSNEGTSQPKMDSEEKNKKLDPKLLNKPKIHLIRCDEISSWKKYYRNEKINIKNLNIDMKTQKLLSRKCRNCSRNKPKSNSYLGLNLNGLSTEFLNNSTNKKLLKLCKPLSVNVQRVTIKDKTICRRAKKVQLADIEEVRKINSTILTAEVAPVSITRCDPPSTANSLRILNDETETAILNLNTINSLELDDLLKKLPVPPLIPINSEKPMDFAIMATHAPIEHYNIDMDSKTNKNNCNEQKSYDDLNKKILNIIKNCPRSKTIRSKVTPVTVHTSDSDDEVLSAVADQEKNKRKQNNDKQNETKKKRKKTKRKDSETTQTSNNALEEWNRQKNLNKKYFQLPNIAPKPSNDTKILSNIILVPSNIYLNNPGTSKDGDRPAVTNTIIDLTIGTDDTQTDQNNDITPIITNVYSLAETENATQMMTPTLVPQDNINTDLATLTRVQLPNVGTQKVQNLPQAGTLVPVTLSGQNVFVQQSTQAQYTSEAGRRFIIIPKSQLKNGHNPLVLPNLKIVNASLTANPVDHIQRMITPNITTEISLQQWVEGKTDKQLVLLQVDSTKPTWTMCNGQNVVSFSDYTCVKPMYYCLPTQCKTRILFPQEKNGIEVYNPPTLQIYEDAANGTTPFAKWVKSIINNTESNSTEDTDTLTETTDLNKSEDRPVGRIQVKSFARLTTQSESFIAPDRVCLNDRLYMKVSERPLKYAMVISALSSVEEFQSLVSEDAPIKLLPTNVLYFDT